MAKSPSPKDIADYRKLLKRKGVDASGLTDPQIARQIQILRGGLYRPGSSKLEELRARAKTTEKVFQGSEWGVTSLLKKAHADLLALERHRFPSRIGGTSTSSLLRKKAKRWAELHRELLAYPPSLLSSGYREALRLVEAWATLAAKVLQGGSPAEKDAVSLLTPRLETLIDGLRKPLG